MTATVDAGGRTDPGEGDGTGAAVQTLSDGSLADMDPLYARLIGRMTRALLDQAPNWEIAFPDGNTGTVVGLPDAAVIAAKTAHQIVDQFKTALLTGLDDLERLGNARLVSPGDVADLIARVAQEVGR